MNRKNGRRSPGVRDFLPKARLVEINGTARDRRALPRKSNKLVGAVGPPTPVISCPRRALSGIKSSADLQDYRRFRAQGVIFPNPKSKIRNPKSKIPATRHSERLRAVSTFGGRAGRSSLPIPPQNFTFFAFRLFPFPLFFRPMHPGYFAVLLWSLVIFASFWGYGEALRRWLNRPEFADLG